MQTKECEAMNGEQGIENNRWGMGTEEANTEQRLRNEGHEITNKDKESEECVGEC